MSIYYFIIIGTIVGYLLGSISYSLLISKIFFKTNLNKCGSGNLGSANVGRTLGPLAGVIVMLLDLLKAGLPAFIMYKIAENNITLTEESVLLPIVFFATGLAACIGHCYSCYAKFKGGKAVAPVAGLLIFMNYRLALVAFVTYLIVFLIFKIISVSSISSAISTMIASLFTFFNKCYLFNNVFESNVTVIFYHIFIFMLGALLIFRHIPNIKRLIKGEEKKFAFGHRNKK